MKKEELEKLKELANSNNIPHNFICNDPTQKDQIDYWNATNPTKILELIESYERSLEVIEFYADRENWDMENLVSSTMVQIVDKKWV